VHLQGIEELVTDKGYHSSAVVQRIRELQSARFHPGEEAERAARLARPACRAAGGVPEPATGAGRVQQELTTTAR
jgi:hypothetical protein